MSDRAATKEIALRAALEEAQERIAQLEALLGCDWRAPYNSVLKLTITEERLLGFLMARNLVTREGAMLLMYGDQFDPPESKVIDIYVMKLRRKLKPHAIQIETNWGRGWFMKAEAKARLKELL